METEEFKNKAKQEFIDQYNRLGLRASGSFEKELEATHTQTKTNTRITILGAKHARYMEEGIKPYKYRNDPKKLKKFIGWAGSTYLKDWVKDKGLKINPYAVAYKIAREGVKVPNGYNKGGAILKPIEAINEKHVPKLIEEHYNTRIEDIKSEIKSIKIK